MTSISSSAMPNESGANKNDQFTKGMAMWTEKDDAVLEHIRRRSGISV